MILSFSVPKMLPYIETGLRQYNGEDVGSLRVKRQTIRRLGPVAQRILSHGGSDHAMPYDLSLWWKSRAPTRRKLGDILQQDAHAYPCQIEYVVTRRDPPFVRFIAPSMTCLFHADEGADEAFQMLAWNDGFDSPEAFREYFVPNPGNVFKGIWYKW